MIQTRIAIGYPHIDVRGKWERTLWSASANGRLHIVEALLGASADPGAGDLGLDSSARCTSPSTTGGSTSSARCRGGADAAPNWFGDAVD